MGGGIGSILGVLSSGNSANTALQVAQLGQQFQQQEQDTVLQMGLSQIQNQQLQTSMIGQNISTVFGLQQQTQQTVFKTTAKMQQGWIQALGGGG